jgi:hypothetical protein
MGYPNCYRLNGQRRSRLFMQQVIGGARDKLDENANSCRRCDTADEHRVDGFYGAAVGVLKNFDERAICKLFGDAEISNSRDANPARRHLTQRLRRHEADWRTLGVGFWRKTSR